MPSPRPPPWRSLGVVREYDFTILKVREHRMEDPRNGSEHLRVIIDAPDWVTVVALRDDGQVVFVRQFRAGVGRDTLELAGGIVEPGESPLQAAARELEEEGGHRARTMRLLGAFCPNPALQNNRCHVVLAEGCTAVHAGAPDPGEDLRIELHPRDTLDALVRDGRVDHALMIGAFHLWQLETRAR